MPDFTTAVVAERLVPQAATLDFHWSEIPSLRLKTNAARVYCADRILVKPLAAVTDLEVLHRRFGTRTIKAFPSLGNLQVLSVPAGLDVDDCIDRFGRSGLVEYAEPDGIARLCVTPSDPLYGQQWALPKIQAPAAWDIQRDASTVVVAVIDNGVDYTHPDFQQNIWTNPGEIPGNGLDDDANGYIDDVHGINALVDVGGNPKPWPAGDPMPPAGSEHGTLVSGVIGAGGNNSQGVAGVCWAVRIMALRCGTGMDMLQSAYIESIDYAVENGARILNLSLGGPDSSANLSVREVVTKARNRGVIVVAALGNDGKNNGAEALRVYPASIELDNIVSVGATTVNDSRWPNSRTA